MRFSLRELARSGGSRPRQREQLRDDARCRSLRLAGVAPRRSSKKNCSQSIVSSAAAGESRRGARRRSARAASTGRSGTPAARRRDRVGRRAPCCARSDTRRRRTRPGCTASSSPVIEPAPTAARRAAGRSQHAAPASSPTSVRRKSSDDDPLVVPAHDLARLARSSSSLVERSRSVVAELVDDLVVKADEQQVQLRDDEVLVVAGVADQRAPLRVARQVDLDEAVAGRSWRSTSSFTPGVGARDPSRRDTAGPSGPTPYSESRSRRGVRKFDERVRDRCRARSSTSDRT